MFPIFLFLFSKRNKLKNKVEKNVGVQSLF